MRELEHVVERAMITRHVGADDGRLHFDVMPVPGSASVPFTTGDGLPALHLRRPEEWPTLREVEDRYIREVLKHCGGKLTGANSATSILDIHYSTLRSRLRAEEEQPS